MVGRVSDTPRGLNERVKAVTDRLEVLSRAIARPSPTLRNDAGHALNLNLASSLPMLVPTATGDDDTSSTIDSALRFHDGGLWVRDPTDTQDRDMNARAVGASGNLVAQGDVNVAGHAYSSGSTVFGNSVASWFHSTGNINADVSIGAGLNIIAGGNVSGASANFGPLTSGQTQTGNLVCGQINASGDIWGLAGHFTNIYYSGTLNGPVSHPELKQNVRAPDEVLGKSPLEAVTDAPLWAWQYRPDIPEVADQAGVDRLGPMVTDMPDAVKTRLPSGYDTPSLDSMVAILWGAVGELADQVRGLEQQLADRVDGDV